MNRRYLLSSGCFAMAGIGMGRECLPQAQTFTGKGKFDRLVQQALQQGWQRLPMAQRVAQFGLAMRGTPYVGYTLEIHDHTESTSANFDGQDCWTYFEIALGLARMVEQAKSSYTPGDLLAEIEWTRYRAGVCNGNYLDRIHYLSEWFYDNDARGNIDHITEKIGPTERIYERKIQEMTLLWKGYRYLRMNPELRAGMKGHEDRIAKYPFRYIPKARVAEVEPQIQSGDIIGIVTNQSGGFCSHVGLALRTEEDGVLRFMHASKNHKKVTLDDRLSTYLYKFKYHAGIIVGRPLARSASIRDASSYRKKLSKITAS